jgi:signal transduction histidine kinase
VFRPGLPQLLRRLALAGLALSLVCYLGYLLYGLHRSGAELEALHRGQLAREAGRRAQAVAYFFSERLNDARSLAADRDLEAYQENKALGMSLKYGLGASLDAVAGAFASFRGERQLGGESIYDRIAFLDADGEVQVDVRADGGGSAPRAPPADGVREALASAGGGSLGARDGGLVMAVPYSFKGRPAGHVVAWLSVPALQRHLLGEDDPPRRAMLLLCAGEVLAGAGQRVGLPPGAAGRIAALGEGETLALDLRPAAGAPWRALARRTPIDSTPLSLVTLLAADDPEAASSQLPVAVTSLVGVLILLGGVFSVQRQRRSFRELERLLESLPFALVLVDRHGRLVLANAAARAFLGHSSSDLRGRAWNDFVPEPSGGGQGGAAREAVARSGVHGARPVLLAEIPFPVGDQSLSVKAFLDLSERKLLERQLRQAQKLEAVGQLAAGIAHEINTPAQFVGDNLRFLSDAFGALAGLTERYRDGMRALDGAPGQPVVAAALREAEEAVDLPFLAEQAPQALGQALEGIGRIGHIVRAMKEFAHPGTQEKSPADLNRALENCVTIARNEYRYVADVVLELGELPPVSCHLGDLNEVFLNLLVNAAHAIAAAAPDGGARGTIRVRTRCTGADRVRIEIEDSGTGIPDAIQDRIFDPFFTTKEVGKGTGQGLAIARSVVVDRHGGTLTFETALGKGTTFRVELPVVPAPGGSAAAG